MAMDPEKMKNMLKKAEDRAIENLLVIEAKDPAAASAILDENLGDGRAAGVMAVSKAAKAHPLYQAPA